MIPFKISVLGIGFGAVALVGVVGAGLAFGQSTAMVPTSAGVALMAKLQVAKAGDIITLAPGDYGFVYVPSRNFNPRVRLDASAARFSGLSLADVHGLTIDGGVIVGPGKRSYGIELKSVSDITINGMTITGAHRGIVLGKSSAVTLSNNKLTGLISDGIDIAQSRLVTVKNNSCRDFAPTATQFDENGKRTIVGDHPDCIQAWSRPASPPVADIVIENNSMEGTMQGIFFGNHVRNGVDDGGFDRIVIRNNVVRVTHSNGIRISDGRDSIVTGNRVSTFPGRANPRSGRPNRSIINVAGERNLVCGNTIADFPASEPTRPCR